MVTVTDFRTAMQPLIRQFRQERPESVEEWNDYYQTLGHFPLYVLAAAVIKVLSERQYPDFPKPGVIQAAAVSILLPPTRTGDEAWADVERAVARYGYNHPPDGVLWTFRDPRTLAVVMQFGWTRICLEEDKTMRWQFIHAYNATSQREDTALAELPAVTDARQLAAADRQAALTAHVAGRLAAGGQRAERNTP